MQSDARKALGFLLAVGVMVLLGSIWLRPLLRFAAGPESEVLELIKTAEKDGLKLQLPTSPPSTLSSTRAHFDRVTVVLDTEERALAHATLDFDGTLDGGTVVSSLGVERIPFRASSGAWQAPNGLAPQLSAVLARLEARRKALEAADAAALCALARPPCAPQALVSRRGWQDLAALSTRRYRVESWHVRVEPEGAQVTERFHLVGALPDRPVDSHGERALTLTRAADGGEFFFSEELM